jgi:hypothetical protein
VAAEESDADGAGLIRARLASTVGSVSSWRFEVQSFYSVMQFVLKRSPF